MKTVHFIPVDCVDASEPVLEGVVPVAPVVINVVPVVVVEAAGVVVVPAVVDGMPTDVRKQSNIQLLNYLF